MHRIRFVKMVASGNDFVVIEAKSQKPEARSFNDLAKRFCDRKYGIGADGLLVLGSSKRADIKMRIFNSDGSEAEMCGNGARCAALYARLCALSLKQNIKLETKAGVIESIVKDDGVKIKLTDPKTIKLDIPLMINGRLVKVNFINTGVPHAVIFVEGLERIAVGLIGRDVRYHKKFFPAGTNVDFVEAGSSDSIKIRTYERGVEDETLACGTGSVAAALIYVLTSGFYNLRRINVVTKSKEILKVYFERERGSFKNVWLEGRAGIVYKGEYLCSGVR